MSRPLAASLRSLVSLVAVLLAAAGCDGLGQLGAAACPEIGPSVDAATARYGVDARADAKIRAFVLAAKDIAAASAQAEQLAATACSRMGRDLGVPPQAMAFDRSVRQGGAAKGACDAVARRIAKLRAQGIQLAINVTPPVCQADVQADAQCQAGCTAAVHGAPADAECVASCRARANVRAECAPARVQVQASQSMPEAMALAATLQANLPPLVHAQVALGERLVGDFDTVVQIGQQLPRLVGQAGARALACIGAATDLSVSASIRVKVTMQASANLRGQVGG
jgi:hypothetical protein